MMRMAYSLLVRCLAPAAFLVVLWRGIRQRGYWQGLRERFGFGATLRNAGLAVPSIWVHAVSLGEMSAAAPLIRALHLRHPGAALVLTTATPAGRARAAALFSEYADIRFLPYDTPGAVRRFLERIQPGVGVIMETELWPNLLRACARRKLPVLIASARLTARSVSRYRRAGALFGDLFAGNVTIAAQSADDAARFLELGAKPAQVSVVGNVKFDINVETHLAKRRQRSNRFVWVAGSTHAGEDEAVLRAHAQLLGAQPRALLLLAPRHRERFNAVAALVKNSGLRCQRRSERAAADGAPGAAAEVAEDCQVLLVDTLGELTRMYASADVAFVGGSLVPVGGHNLLEPAALGLPVLSGPHQANNKDIAAKLLGSGAALQVNDAAELGVALQRLAADPAQRRRMGEAGASIVAANRGSVAALIAILEPLAL